MKLVEAYRSITTVRISTGDTALFWSDIWHSDGLLQSQFPRLYSFALDKNLSVQEVIECQDRAELFFLPLSTQAYQEFQSLQVLLGSVLLNPLEKDQWCTIWAGGTYTAGRFYHHSFRHIQASKIYACIWKCKVVLRVKVFAWLLVSDRLNTRDMLQRRHWNVTDIFHCPLCTSGLTEDWKHLFFTCLFSARIWTYLQVDWVHGNSFEQVFFMAKRSFRQPFFTEVVILAAWNIWKQRNEAVFQNVLPSFRGWKRGFLHDITMLMHRVKVAHLHQYSSWIDTLV